MRVLIGCEFSGTVRDAFIARGHDALSCDVLPTESPGPHYLGDVRDIIGDGWDIGIFHPPCRYLANSGVWLLNAEDGRRDKMREAAGFFRELLDVPIPRVAVENPKMHGEALALIGCRPTQIVQPWEYGHAETKRTGLWLRGLPPLMVTDDVSEQVRVAEDRDRHRIENVASGPNRWKVRSVTYAGIAAAMADQWADDLAVPRAG
jgi:hypothetical protein